MTSLHCGRIGGLLIEHTSARVSAQTVGAPFSQLVSVGVEPSTFRSHVGCRRVHVLVFSRDGSGAVASTEMLFCGGKRSSRYQCLTLPTEEVGKYSSLMLW